MVGQGSPLQIIRIHAGTALLVPAYGEINVAGKQVGRMKRSASGSGAGRGDNAGTALLVPAYE